MDRESYPKYELTAEVKDQGTPFRSDRALVEIKILDVNDNAPVFLEPAESIIEVLEKQPQGTEVVQVIADDADQDENGSITYEIAKGKAVYLMFADFYTTPIMRCIQPLLNEGGLKPVFNEQFNILLFSINV